MFAWKRPSRPVENQAPSLQAFYRRKEEVEWNRFLKESVYCNEGVYHVQSRAKAIRTFVIGGLYPWIQKKGYVWSLSEDKITQGILHILFAMKRGLHVTIPNRQPKSQFEFYDQFLYICDTDNWDQLWKFWGRMEDFTESGYAYRFRFLLQNYVWNHIDIENSPVAKHIEEEIAAREEFEEQRKRGEISKGKDDPYLQDMLQNSVRDKHNY